MYLRSKSRFKDGKLHRYWSIVESQRLRGGRVIQRQVLYLGEINDSQKATWCKSIEVFDEHCAHVQQMALYPEDRVAPEISCEVVQIKLSELSVRRARQWGACWLACEIWSWLKLDEFWEFRLAPSRQGTDWLKVLKTLVCYRLIAPGSEWRLHRQWYERSAMADLLGTDASIAQIDTLYRCHDKLLTHKKELFSHLRQRWESMFKENCEVLLYDLTSTYFECDVHDGERDKRQFGYSRDKRSDCVQVVIALIVTPSGLPIAYEVMPGNTSDKTTLWDFIQKIEKQYGKVHRTWIMDRGIPTEETLEKMRSSDYPIRYLVGTPKGRLTALEKSFLAKPWEKARESVKVKLLPYEEELYILARSEGRVDKERAMRQRRLKKLVKRLQELQKQDLTRDQLLLKLGAAKKEAGRAYHLLDIHLPPDNEPVTTDTFYFTLKKEKLRQVRQREGHYLLRSNLTNEAPAKLWELYIQLTEIEQAFKEIKNDLEIRPIYHQKEDRIEAHIFIAFMAYCLQITLRQRLRDLAPGLTARAVIEKMAGIQMVDVHVPTTDGRHLILPRYTDPDTDQRLLLNRLKIDLPQQPPPRIAASSQMIAT